MLPLRPVLCIFTILGFAPTTWADPYVGRINQLPTGLDFDKEWYLEALKDDDTWHTVRVFMQEYAPNLKVLLLSLNATTPPQAWMFRFSNSAVDQVEILPAPNSATLKLESAYPNDAVAFWRAPMPNWRDDISWSLALPSKLGLGQRGGWSFKVNEKMEPSLPAFEGPLEYMYCTHLEYDVVHWGSSVNMPDFCHVSKLRFVPVN